LETPQNVAELHAWLAAEYGYPGSLRSVERYVRAAYPVPPLRARRRVETPPGAQAQADWAEFPGVWVGTGPVDLLAFALQLSHSRADAVVWSERKDQLAWLHVHNEALARLGGVPASIRVDNEKTAVVRGAGAWGVVNPVYRRYAKTLRFHIDLCAPRQPQAKGKVERRIRDRRCGVNPYGQRWRDLAELQSWTDTRVEASAHRRRCPVSGTDVYTAWLEERALLGPLPALPAPFDVVVERRVAPDCTVQFEGRTYSVPFRFLGQRIEVRGTALHVEVFAGGHCIARHVRHSRSRIVLEAAHFEGPATATVLPPTPLGRFGRRLAEIAALTPEQRPLDLYAALAEVAR
jgi:transposase